MVVRAVSWFFWIVFWLVLGADIFRSVEAMAFQPYALGELWYSFAQGSLNLMQAIVQRYLHPAVWDPVMIILLRWPTALYLALMAALFTLLSRRRGEQEGKQRRRWY